ncbi:hypothetical protein AKUG0417_04680 [Apilactobacillus kunkeei]|nr:hypothetical protein AKUG0417_04680 [Apilactobacillus kunkeei]
MKRLLIFEPNTTSGIKIVNTAKNMGIYVIAVTSENLFKTIYPKDLKIILMNMFFVILIIEKRI